jgi:hypothetical protein
MGHASGNGNDIGIGLMTGATSGITAKFYTHERLAFDLGFGSFHDGFDYHSQGLSVHGDILWHPAVLAHNSDVALPLYVGLGSGVGFHDHGSLWDHTVIGGRAPIGLALEFVRAPLDVFVELAPGIDFIGTGHSGDFYLGGSLGGRYFF